MATKAITAWDKKSIPGIDVTISARYENDQEFMIAYLFACNWDEKAEIGEQYSIGTPGVHATPTGRKEIVGELRFHSVNQSAIVSFVEMATGKTPVSAPSLKDINSLGGIDIVYQYVDPLTKEVFRQEILGVLFDQTSGAVGIDVLKQEEVIGFTARDVKPFNKIEAN